MNRLFAFLLAGLAGCSVEPAPLLTIPEGHPGHAESGNVAYEPPPNPFKGEIVPTPPAAEKPSGHEGHGEQGKAPALKKEYPLDVCLVSGQKLGSMGKPAVITHEGREIRFCCPACIPKFKEDPAKYLKQLDEAEKKKTAAPKHEHHGSPK